MELGIEVAKEMGTETLLRNQVPNRVILAEWPRATVMKLNDFALTDTKTREATIDTNDKWKEFAKDAYLVWYYPGGEWSDPANKNWTLSEQAAQSPRQLQQTSDLLVLSGYHTLLGKRVIIDGCKRSVSIETLVQNDKPIPPVRVLEIYGTQIHVILPADFCNLVADALR